MMLIELALAAAVAAQGAPEPKAPPTREVALRHFEACRAGRVSIRYDADLQDDVVDIATGPDVTDEQLRCVAETAFKDAYSVSVPPAAEARYRDAEYGAVKALLLADARAWASKRGLLDRVPLYVEGKDDDAAFAARLEALCGPKARGALRGHMVDPEWALRLPPFKESQKTLECLMNVSTLADFKLGFIGNEAYRE